MIKALISGIVLSALVATSAAAGPIRAANALPAATVVAAPGATVQSDTAAPEPARPTPKKKNSFFGLPLLGLLLGGGAAGAVAASGGSSTSSPQ